MAVTTRPYRIVFNGQVRMVEASHVNNAVAHLANELVEDKRPATAKEVAQFYRDGGMVEVAGRVETRADDGTGALPPVEANEGKAVEWPVGDEPADAAADLGDA